MRRRGRLRVSGGSCKDLPSARVEDENARAAVRDGPAMERANIVSSGWSRTTSRSISSSTKSEVGRGTRNDLITSFKNDVSRVFEVQ